MDIMKWKLYTLARVLNEVMNNLTNEITKTSAKLHTVHANYSNSAQSQEKKNWLINKYKKKKI